MDLVTRYDVGAILALAAAATSIVRSVSSPIRVYGHSHVTLVMCCESPSTVRAAGSSLVVTVGEEPSAVADCQEASGRVPLICTRSSSI